MAFRWYIRALTQFCLSLQPLPLMSIKWRWPPAEGCRSKDWGGWPHPVPKSGHRGTGRGRWCNWCSWVPMPTYAGTATGSVVLCTEIKCLDFVSCISNDKSIYYGYDKTLIDKSHNFCIVYLWNKLWVL